MTLTELLNYRLHNQHISRQIFTKPGDIVTWMGAVQAQDYAAAKWALGLRLEGSVDADIDGALADGSIIRTHIMRPTWHFVSPADLRSLLMLTATRVKVAAAYQHSKIGLDDKILLRAQKVLVKAMEGGKNLNRAQIHELLTRAKIDAGELRFVHIMMRAELDGLVCSGPRIGKQFTYGLLEERVPPVRPLSMDEALAGLTLRYFTSHGPATLKDFSWWSGLTLAHAKDGLEMVKKDFRSAAVGEQVYWMHKDIAAIVPAKSSMGLLPAFDEYLISYTDRSAAIERMHAPRVATNNGIFNPVVVVKGKVSATWKRIIKKDIVDVDVQPFIELPAAKKKAIKALVDKYGRFIGLKNSLSFHSL